MLKPVVTDPAFRKLRFALTLASCLFTYLAFAQPNPDITGETIVCPSAEHFYTTTYVPGNTYAWSVSSGGIITQNNGNFIAVKWTGPQNSIQSLQVTETDPMMNAGTDNIIVYIKNTVLSCDNVVHVSLDQVGQALITAEMLLDGNYNTYDGFQVTLSLPNGINIANPLLCANIGQQITGKVTDACTGNSCWSIIKVEDKKAPQWTCPTSPVEIPCDTNLDNYPHPPVADNCDSNPLISMTGIQVDNNDICDNGVTITRWWVASDDYGNESACTQVLYISNDQPLHFPEDRIWLCTQYNTWPNVTNPTPWTGNPATTGAGTPVGASGPYCPYSFVHSDDTIATCGNTFKIIRTWTVLDWCTGLVITEDSNGNDNEQIIKIIDITKPTMTVAPVSLAITVPGSSALTCVSKDFLPPPTSAFDDCGAVEIRIFTPVGEAVYVNGVDGAQGGHVPSPGLNLGIHPIIYKAIDGCGNVREITVNAVVADVTPPVVICDEITSVNLDQNGEALVYAATFDDGSYDNCCIETMLVKRMGEPDLNFGPYTYFDCNDDEVMVVLRVIDCFGNFNECMVTAIVKDKMLPTCVAPPQKIIPCTQLPPDITDAYVHGFGEALAFDNCDATIIEMPYAVNINNCGEGHIIRFFKAVDDDGNTSLGTCEQHIYVTPSSDWLISFPENWTGECGDSINAPQIVVGNFGCDMLAVAYEDTYFGLSNDSACFKIVRTWKVINWCSYDPALAPIKVPTNPFGVNVDEDDYDNYSSYEYQQIIKIHDTTPPTLSYPFDDKFCTIDSNCATGEVNLPIQIEGECTNDFEIVYHIDLGNNGGYEVNGTGFFQGTLPIGNHRALYLVQDGCGNEAELTVNFSVVDCKKPTPVCKNGLIVEIMQTGMIEVCAASLNDYSYDNCPGPLKFSWSSDVNNQCKTYDCFMLGQHSVNVWVTDAAGNQDFCTTFIEIQDNMLHCAGGDPIIGNLSTMQNEPMVGVSVHLNSDMGNNMVETDAQGNFTFDDLANGHDYSVTPEKDDDPLNGVTTFDLVLISKHILGILPLDSPYKIIAADANNSQAVTTFDLVTMRKLVLFIDLEFANNTSWRFIDKDYVFPNPANPWSQPFPEVININDLDQAVSGVDFVAVKIGDVNNSASPNNFTHGGTDDRSPAMLMFEAQDRWVAAGETVQLTLQAKDFEEVYGFQFTLDFDALSLEFQSVTPTELTSGENYGLTLLNEGAVTALWYDTEMHTMADGEPVLKLDFKVKNSGQLSDMLGISSRFTNAEAYLHEDMELHGVDLDFANGVTAANDVLANGYQLFQNVPNPFANRTVIGFELPQPGHAKLSIFDATGRILREIEGLYPSGYSEVTVEAKDLPGNAVLFYKIESNGFTAVRQMTVVK